jgi:hypothetical protein
VDIEADVVEDLSAAIEGDKAIHFDHGILGAVLFRGVHIPISIRLSV